MAEVWEEAKNLLTATDIKGELDKTITVADDVADIVKARDEYVKEVIRLAFRGRNLFNKRESDSGSYISSLNYKLGKYKIYFGKVIGEKGSINFNIKFKSSTIIDLNFTVDKSAVIDIKSINKNKRDKYYLLKGFVELVENEINDIKSLVKA